MTNDEKKKKKGEKKDEKKEENTFQVNPMSLFKWYENMIKQHPLWIVASQGLSDRKYQSKFPQNDQGICDKWILAMHDITTMTSLCIS